MDATFWATVGLVLFLALVIFAGLPAMVNKALDSRAEKIRNELEEARKLREEATKLLAHYQQKRKEAEQEAAEIVSAAKHEAESLVTEAKARTEEYVTRRTALAEQKIAQAERDAVAEVRTSAVEIAVAAAGKLLADTVDSKADDALFKAALSDVKARLN
ncbi:F0F1 ATP synthase subunit B [Aquamicrobium zhengzhouense]|uniref:ATP synthase subunit b n=1 Tax=Aquamicrobium zhengzhouense TaxID=2781738 RepID=A0ABS0SF65_9HYPH|nr:F0F1 ATP synthase subunit B [Aquamicrobium zhengzhouense]MBI1621943.1 F0F1 ATP synthase subunit B [Aquamicrobium zhengzhouense]